MIKYKSVRFAIYIILGVSIIFLKDTYVENLGIFIGALITMYGIDCGIQFFLDIEERKPHDLCKGIIQTILGVCTIILFKDFETVCVIWGVWAVMREADEIAECYELFKEKNPWILSFLESLVAIVLSIMLIMEPVEHHALTHMYLLIVELFFAVSFPHLVKAHEKYSKLHKEANK